MKGELDMGYESQKWFDYADSVPIKDSDGKKALELVREPKGLFLYVKCSDNKHKKQYRKICMSDALYQMFVHMTDIERKVYIKACLQAS